MAACFHQRMFFEASSTFQTIPLCQVHVHYHISRRNHDTVSQWHISPAAYPSRNHSHSLTLPCHPPGPTHRPGAWRGTRAAVVSLWRMWCSWFISWREKCPRAAGQGKSMKIVWKGKEGVKIYNKPHGSGPNWEEKHVKNTKTHRNPLKSNVQWLNPWRLA